MTATEKTGKKGVEMTLSDPFHLSLVQDPDILMRRVDRHVFFEQTLRRYPDQWPPYPDNEDVVRIAQVEFPVPSFVDIIAALRAINLQPASRKALIAFRAEHGLWEKFPNLVSLSGIADGNGGVMWYPVSMTRIATMNIYPEHILGSPALIMDNCIQFIVTAA